VPVGKGIVTLIGAAFGFVLILLLLANGAARKRRQRADFCPDLGGRVLRSGRWLQPLRPFLAPGATAQDFAHAHGADDSHMSMAKRRPATTTSEMD
jgi:hypothetical protein